MTRRPLRSDCLRRSHLLCALALFAITASPRALQSGATTRVSVTTGCAKPAFGVGHSRQPAISSDGRFVVFSSEDLGLGQGDATIGWFANLDGAGTFGPLNLITSDLDEPTAIAAAMLGGNALPDVVTASFMDDRIAWYANQLGINGGFDGPLDISTTMGGTNSVTTGDMDGDGDVDVLATAPDDENSVWFSNDGQGGFGGPMTINPYGRTLSVFPADVDGDGDLDAMYTIDFSTGEIAWLENRDGAGSFCTQHAITTAADAPWGVHAADLDGDGDLDVVSTSGGAPTGPRLQWFANLDGQGSYGPPTIVSTAAEPTGVGAGDLDGDGDNDLVAGFSDDHRMVWFSNLDGLGSFGPPIVLDANVATPSSVQVVDLDLDGDPDILYSSTGNGEVAWFRNTDGQGTFTAKTVIGAPLLLTRQARAADIDADGDLDVIAADSGLEQVCWFRNLGGAASFSGKLVIASSIVGAYSVGAVDIDADGRLDVVSTSFNDDKVYWHRNTNGLGTFGPAQLISSTCDGAHSVVGLDLDGDGDGDVVSFGQIDNQATWYDNTNGLGTAFVAHDLAPAGGVGGHQVVTADLDADGDADILAAGGGLGDVTWYENPDGQAGFGEKHSIMTNTKSPRCVHGADIDGDGDIDAVSASFNDDKIAWSRNLNGLGSFSAQQVISTTVDGARWVTTGDMDGDNDLDVLVAADLENRVSWFENMNGVGSFGTEHTVTASAPAVRQAVLADIDGDLDLDVLVPAYGDDTTTWHENDGTGLSFTPHVVYDGPTVGATGIAAADVDADGDLDLLLASASPGPDGLEVYRHDRFLLETTWVSRTLNGTGSDAQNPALSSDGRYVAFESISPNLVPGPDSNPLDVYLRDVQAETTERIDVSTAGVQANNVSLSASVSGDGRYVAFDSYANNLVAGDTTCCSVTDVFLRDRLTGTTIRVNERPDATPPDGAGQGVISTDGQYVAFVSGDPLLVAGDTNDDADVFVRNIATGVITRVSLASGGVEIPDGGNSQQPALSADARFVAFRCHANLDPADDNVYQDVYVHDRQSLTTTWVSATSTGGAANNPCEDARISADGRYVSFVSRATNLVAGTTTTDLRVYRRDLQTGTIQLMSVASDGTAANASIVDQDLSGDGQLVTFDTVASNLVSSDTDNVSDVFVHGVDPWFPLGCEEEGGGGAPLLKGSGPLAGGTAGKLGLSNAKPSSLAMLFVSLASMPVAFKGGVLVAFPPALQLPLFVGPSGALNLNFTWPGGVPHGIKVYFHFAIADPAAAFGVALSSAIRGVTP